MSNKMIVPNAPDDRWADIVEKLVEELTDDIPEKVVRATELMLAGYPVSKAAKEVGVTTDTVKSWIKKYPTVAHVLADGRRYMQMWRMAQLEGQFVKAVEKSDEILSLSLFDDAVNQKVAATVAQHARYIIGLFAGQQVDINVKSTVSDPVMKAKADALDFIAQRLAQRMQSDDAITVSYRVVDSNPVNNQPLLNESGQPAHGDLGVLNVTDEGAQCHVCGERVRLMSVHISKQHGMSVANYEAAFLLDEGTITNYDNYSE